MVLVGQVPAHPVESRHVENERREAGADAVSDDQPGLPVLVAVVGDHQAAQEGLVVGRFVQVAAREDLDRIVEAPRLLQPVGLDAVDEEAAELVVDRIGRAREQIAWPGPVALQTVVVVGQRSRSVEEEPGSGGVRVQQPGVAFAVSRQRQPREEGQEYDDSLRHRRSRPQFVLTCRKNSVLSRRPVPSLVKSVNDLRNPRFILTWYPV